MQGELDYKAQTGGKSVSVYAMIGRNRIDAGVPVQKNSGIMELVDLKEAWRSVS